MVVADAVGDNHAASRCGLEERGIDDRPIEQHGLRLAELPGATVGIWARVFNADAERLQDGGFRLQAGTQPVEGERQPPPHRLTRSIEPAGYRSPGIAPTSKASSSRGSVSGASVISAAATFSSRFSMLRVPGIGTMPPACARSHASASCAEDTPR